MLRTVPCLWMDHQAEQAANFYVSIFPNSRIVQTTYHGHAGQEHHGKPAGSVLTVTLELDGQEYTLLNGGPAFKLSEAISIQIMCEDQKEIDYYWDKLSQDGDPDAQQCGWLKDKFGLSWQIVPTALLEYFNSHDPKITDPIMNVLLGMKKIDLAAMHAAAGKPR